MLKKIIVFGPGPKFKGGIANYTVSLAKAIDKEENTEVWIVSWTQQYPSIIPRDFIDRSSKVDLLEGTNVRVEYITNYNNFFSWKRTVEIIKRINPQIIVFQWAIAIQGLPLGYIANKIKKNLNCEIIFDIHVVSQKEASIIDKFFITYGLNSASTYIVHSHKTFEELNNFFPNQKFSINETGERKRGETKSVIKLYHPVYDMFNPIPSFDKQSFKKKLKLKKFVFLSFGIIRKYKGLHYTIPAFAKLAEKSKDVSLLIVGESFWQTLDSKKLSTKIKKLFFGTLSKILLKKKKEGEDYNPLALIDFYNLNDKVVVINNYVPNEEVYKYFQVSDCNILFYLTATPSGVESIAYNFKLPSIATKVGHFPETIKDGYNGYLAEPEDIDSMCEVMEKFINNPIPPERVAETAANMSWKNYAAAILKNS